MQALEDRQHERGRLAGSGLGAGHEIAAGEDDRDRLGLDRSGRVVAGIGDGTQQFGPQPELGKGHGSPDVQRARRSGPGQAKWYEGCGQPGETLTLTGVSVEPGMVRPR